jgi:hypothetical protein
MEPNATTAKQKLSQEASKQDQSEPKSTTANAR